MLGNIVTGCSVLAPAGMLGELSVGPRRQHPHRRAADHLRRDRAVHRLAADGVADQPDRAPHPAHGDARGARAHQCRIRASRPTTRACWSFAWSCWRSARSIRRRRRAPRALIVPAEKRGSTIAYIFLGWSLAAAVGLPLITFIASRYGWRAVYGGIGADRAASVSCCWRGVCRGGLMGAPVDLKTWADVGRNRDDRAAAADHDAADVRPVRGVHLHGPAAGEADGRRAGCDRAGVCAATACAASSASRSQPASSIPGAPTRPRCCSRR